MSIDWLPRGFSEEYVKQQGERLAQCFASYPPRLNALRHKIEACCECPRLIDSRMRYRYSKPTFGFGNAQSSVFLIAQSPGYKGCGTTGFVFEPKSRTGEIYEKSLKAAGLTFEDVYTTNLVKCCPPDVQAPDYTEVRNCSRFLLREIRLIRPYAIISTHSESSCWCPMPKGPASQQR